MTILTIEAFDTSSEFAEMIAANYGVTILGTSQGGTVDFEGERDNLIKMFNDHWTEGNVEDHLVDPAITWLNMTGDISLAWDKENEEPMLAMIEAKMKQGYSFFILKPRLLGLGSPKKVLAKSIKEIRKAGKVVADDSILDAAATLRPKLDDPDLEKAVTDGTAKLVRAESKPKETLRRATSAKEVLRNQTVAVRPIVGG